MSKGSPQSWEKRLTEADVPCATVHSIEQIVAHPQVVDRGFLNNIETPYGPVRLAGAGFRVTSGSASDQQATDRQSASHHRPAYRPLAMPGEHNNEILEGLGFSNAQIAAMRESNVIGPVVTPSS